MRDNAGDKSETEINLCAISDAGEISDSEDKLQIGVRNSYYESVNYIL